MYTPKKIVNPNSVMDIAYNNAKDSPCNYKLGAVITKGRSKIMCSSFNTNMRTTYLGEVSCCQHAEMAVATKFINTHVRRNQSKVSTAFL